MKPVALYAFRDARRPARRLADALGIAAHPVALRHFPDGESLVRVPAGAIAATAILYRSLDDPNAKLVELMLAAGALRAGGARHVLLVAPYLAYMRQDVAFNAGEAVSATLVGGFLARHFDGVITVDPHLHRIARLDLAVPGIAARSVGAAPVLAALMRADWVAGTILVGPDVESRPWVERLAGRLGADWAVGEKRRLGDRQVELTIGDPARFRGRPAIIVDDVLSSGETIRSCAERLKAAGATSVEAVVTHCLARRATLARLQAAGIDRIRSTDCVPGSTNAASIAPVLAPEIEAVISELAVI